ncbi:MAG: hypothetical protein U0Q12_00610 [Vicinamibacterales bacterium]
MPVLIPDEIIVDAADAGMHHILIGMAHRGSVERARPRPEEADSADRVQGPDRATHGCRIDLGQSATKTTGARLATARARQPVVITMAPNPSHLEFVDPVVVGMAARAAARRPTAAALAAFNPE